MKRKTFLALSLLLTLLILMSACSPAKSTTSNPGTSTTTKTPTTTSSSVNENPTEITMFYQESGQNYPDGFKHNDNWLFNQICEIANVRVTDLIVPAYADTQTKFNLMMSSGEIPDLILRNDVTAMKQYGMEGAFLPTKEIILNSSVMSLIYNDTQLTAMQSGDSVAYIIQNPPIPADYETLWVRQDLLEELGYTTIPDTLDGLVEAARKLKDKYPDSLPFEGPGLSWRSHWIIAPFNTSYEGWMYYPERDAVCNVFEGDNVVKCVTFARSLYSEGLLDQEFITTTSDDDTQKKITKNVLVYYSNIGSMTVWLQRFYNTDQNNVRLIPIMTPMADGVGVDKYYRYPTVLGTSAFGISAKTEVENGVIRFIEALYSDEIRISAIYGREDIDFEVINGMHKPILPSAIDNAWRSVYGWMFINNLEMLKYRPATAITSNPSMSDEEKTEYITLLGKTDDAIIAQVYAGQTYNPFSLAQPISDDLINKANECKEQQKTLFAKTMMGEISIEDFIVQKDALVSKYQDVTDAYNAKVDEAKVLFGIG
jgi:ABC-type glycerol-3-phosphate transport system substrate-binding protein